MKMLTGKKDIIESVDPVKLSESWKEIVSVIKSVPSYEECKKAMEKAECKITVGDIEKDETLFKNCVKYSPYMRKRITLLRLKDMIY